MGKIKMPSAQPRMQAAVFSSSYEGYRSASLRVRRITRGLLGAVAAGFLVMNGTGVFAASVPSQYAVAINTSWTLLAAFLVFFMQAGFAMLEGGSTPVQKASPTS